jgi:hypothetical protein
MSTPSDLMSILINVGITGNVGESKHKFEAFCDLWNIISNINLSNISDDNLIMLMRGYVLSENEGYFGNCCSGNPSARIMREIERRGHLKSNGKYLEIVDWTLRTATCAYTPFDRASVPRNYISYINAIHNRALSETSHKLYQLEEHLDAKLLKQEKKYINTIKQLEKENHYFKQVINLLDEGAVSEAKAIVIKKQSNH